MDNAYKIVDIYVKPKKLDGQIYYVPGHNNIDDALKDFKEIVTDSRFDVDYAAGRFVLIDKPTGKELTDLGVSFTGHQYDAGDALQNVIREYILNSKELITAKFADNEFAKFIKDNADKLKNDIIKCGEETYPLKVPYTNGGIYELAYVTKKSSYYCYDEMALVFDEKKLLLTDSIPFTESALYETAEEVNNGEDEYLYVDESWKSYLEDIRKEVENDKEME